MNKTLYIKDEITNNTNITNDGYVTYLALLCLMRKDKKLYYININLLTYVLTDVFPAPRSFFNSISNGIINLADTKIIKITNDIDSTKKKYEWIVDLSYIYERNGYFSKAEIDEIRKILFTSKHFGSATSLLRFYIYLLTTIHKNKDEMLGVGFTSVSDMSTTTGLNEKTIYSYLERLENLELIYVYRPKVSIVKKDGNIKEIPSSYGRLCDKDNIITVGTNYETKYITQKTSKEKKNNLRSLSQKYSVVLNCLRDGKKIPYDDKTLKEIYYAIKELNKKYEDDSRNERIKQLDIFSDYDFYEK